MVLSGPLDNITSPLGFGVVNATRSGALNWRHVVTRRGNALEFPPAPAGPSAGAAPTGAGQPSSATGFGEAAPQPTIVKRLDVRPIRAR